MSFQTWLCTELSHYEEIDTDTYVDYIARLFEEADDEDLEEAISELLSPFISKKNELQGLLGRTMTEGRRWKEASSSAGTRVLAAVAPKPLAPVAEQKKPTPGSTTKAKHKTKYVPLDEKELAGVEEQEEEQGEVEVGEEEEDVLSPVEMLRTVFPDLDDEFLEDQLAQADMDLTLTVARLLEWRRMQEEERQQDEEEVLFGPSSGSGSPPAAPRPITSPLRQAGEEHLKVTSHNSPPSSLRPPLCRHFLAGGCFRADCRFSHDMSSTVCSFWLKGECLKGDACGFLHGYDDSALAARPPPTHKAPKQEAAEVNLLDKGEFPTLPGAASVTKRVVAEPRAVDHPAGVGGESAATVLKLSSLMEEFSWVPRNFVRDIFFAATSSEEAR